jgi:hypothetical protein
MACIRTPKAVDGEMTQDIQERPTRKPPRMTVTPVSLRAGARGAV